MSASPTENNAPSKAIGYIRRNGFNLASIGLEGRQIAHNRPAWNVT